MPVLPHVASQLPYRLAIGAGCAITAAALIASQPAPQRPAPQIAIILPTMPAAVAPAVVTPAVAAPAVVVPVVKPPVARSSELWFVFAAGDATYVKLADLEPDAEHGGVAGPRHGKVVYAHGEDGVEAAIASVAPRNVPAAYAGWKGKKLKVDNTCEATIVGFAVVSRLVGSASYAGRDAWDAEGVMENGQRMLAAKLDGCSGTFARTASLPDLAILTKQHDAVLEQAAIEAVIASAPARDTEREWREQGLAQARTLVPAWRAPGTVTAEVLRHPGTGEIFVSAHAQISGGCGEPEANVWGLFRVVDGELVTVQLRQLGEIQTIDLLLDVDGDGEPELLGKPWLGNAELLTHASGDDIDQLGMPFHGCPC
jgi:hypothetical protein